MPRSVRPFRRDARDTHDQTPSLYDALLGMSDQTVIIAAELCVIWSDTFLLDAQFGYETVRDLAFPPESHFTVVPPSAPGLFDVSIVLPRVTPTGMHMANDAGTGAGTGTGTGPPLAVPGAPQALVDLARRTRQFLELGERWYASSWRAQLEERTKWGSLAIYLAIHVMIRRDVYKLPRSDPGCRTIADVLLRMCLSVGDKMQYFKWVSFGGGGCEGDPTYVRNASS